MTSTLLRTSGASPVLEQRTRALADTDARLIRADEGDGRRFVGHAAVYDKRTAIGNPLRWGWYEELAAGMFDKTLSEADARFLVDHDSRMLVARMSAGDLALASDDIGLAVDAGLDEELSYVRDLARNLEKRRITGMSFGFYVVQDEWSKVSVDVQGADGRTQTVDADLRRITEVKLLEVSAVTFPAYEDTDAGIRSLVTEVRAARGLPTTDSAPASGGERREPGETTRGGDDAEPGETTRGSQRDPLEERARALAARYRIR